MANEKLCFKNWLECPDDKQLKKTRRKMNKKSPKKRVYGLDWAQAGVGNVSGADGGGAAMGEAASDGMGMHNGNIPGVATANILGNTQLTQDMKKANRRSVPKPTKIAQYLQYRTRAEEEEGGDDDWENIKNWTPESQDSVPPEFEEWLHDNGHLDSQGAQGFWDEMDAKGLDDDAIQELYDKFVEEKNDKREDDMYWEHGDDGDFDAALKKLMAQSAENEEEYDEFGLPKNKTFKQTKFKAKAKAEEEEPTEEENPDDEDDDFEVDFDQMDRDAGIEPDEEDDDLKIDFDQMDRDAGVEPEEPLELDTDELDAEDPYGLAVDIEDEQSPEGLDTAADTWMQKFNVSSKIDKDSPDFDDIVGRMGAENEEYSDEEMEDEYSFDPAQRAEMGEFAGDTECPMCDGTGMDGEEECDACDGIGYIESEPDSFHDNFDTASGEMMRSIGSENEEDVEDLDFDSDKSPEHDLDREFQDPDEEMDDGEFDGAAEKMMSSIGDDLVDDIDDATGTIAKWWREQVVRSSKERGTDDTDEIEDEYGLADDDEDEINPEEDPDEYERRFDVDPHEEEQETTMRPKDMGMPKPSATMPAQRATPGAGPGRIGAGGGPPKIDRARLVFQRLVRQPDITRNDIIAAFVQDVDVTQSTAVSYYERLAKEAGLTGSDDTQAAMGQQGGTQAELDTPAEQMPADVQNEPDDTMDAEGDQDRRGIVRQVDDAHLVFKRQTEEGSFEELWVYNVGTKMDDELKVRRAILAGTDIPQNRTQSDDGSQTYKLDTMGNAQMLHITGLPN